MPVPWDARAGRRLPLSVWPRPLLLTGLSYELQRLREAQVHDHQAAH